MSSRSCLCKINHASSSTDDDVEPSWCLVESQDWVGSDVIRPDCSDDPSDPSCSDATNVSPANERLANLYGDDVVSQLYVVDIHLGRIDCS